MAGFASRPYRPPGNRLKAVHLEPLETVGLPSKGDNRFVGKTRSICLSTNIGRLLDFNAQEDYYRKIVDRYQQSKTNQGDSNSIDLAFASLSLDGKARNSLESPKYNITQAQAGAKPDLEPRKSPKEVATIMMAMRKLREAVVASARKDAFALEAYVFIIRATILEKHMESYQPALLHLLHMIHPVTPLTTRELNEFVGYRILDLACRLNDLALAYHARYYYHYKDPTVEAVLKSLVHGDWCEFWRMGRQADAYQKRLMEWGEGRMRKHAVNCVGKSYLSLNKVGLTRALNQGWEELEDRGSMGWQLEGDIVKFRRVKGK